ILDAVSFTIDDREIMALLGRSGAGKSAVLRAIAGLDRVAGGRILFGDRDVTDLPAAARDVGVVFSEPHLIPSATARWNISMPLRARSMDPGESSLRVTAESRALGIESLLDRRPGTLAAGEQQLVQIARAMVRVPTVLLLDEPLSRLDPIQRVRLQRDLRELQEGYGVTTLYVTKDEREAMAMAESVTVIDRGRVVQSGPSEDVRAWPAHRVVAELTGPLGTFPAVVERDKEGFALVAPGVRLRAWAPALDHHLGRAVIIGVRPEDVVADPNGNAFATVQPARYPSRAGSTSIEIARSGLTARSLPGDPGARVRVRLQHVHIFESDGTLVATTG
ncbi:MAG: ABC transporter ATP-binding protein, partial [Acidimicrobiia bacterium]|nr:ABC transporter ATP-binding protein [Acidimicrobiia bacterium]